MPKITIHSLSKKNPQETFVQLKEFVSESPDLKKLDSSHSWKFSDSQHRGRAQGSRFQANFWVEGLESGSRVEVVVELPWMLSGFRGKIQSTLKEKLDLLFA